MKIRDGYVCEDAPDGMGQVWMGRALRLPIKANEGFEATLQQATGWTMLAEVPDLDDGDPVREIAGVPVMASALQSVWAWVSAGAPVDVAAIEFEGVRGVVVRGAGRVAILAQCIPLSELECDA